MQKARHALIRFGLLEQRLPDTPDDAADRLTPRGARVDDPARIVCANEAVQAHEAQIFVDANLGKQRREAEDRLRPFCFLDRIVVTVRGKRVDAVAREKVAVCDGSRPERERTVCRDDVLEHAIRERCIASSQREGNGLVAHGVGGEQDRRPGICHRARSDGRVGFGQARITQTDIDLVRRQPQRIRGHLAHHRVSPAADLVHARLDQCRTIAPERDAGLCGPSPMRIDGGGDALPDEITTIAHRARLGLALVPAEALRAFGEASTQAARRERAAAVRIVAGIVAKP